MGRIGFWEIVVILGVFILLFGAKKIPEIAAAIGKALREFKKAGEEVERTGATSDSDDSKKNNP
jgi:sec-independent protein translocase protein TatA